MRAPAERRVPRMSPRPEGSPQATEGSRRWHGLTAGPADFATSPVSGCASQPPRRPGTFRYTVATGGSGPSPDRTGRSGERRRPRKRTSVDGAPELQDASHLSTARRSRPCRRPRTWAIHPSSGSTPSAKFASRNLHERGRNLPSKGGSGVPLRRGQPQHVVVMDKNPLD